MYWKITTGSDKDAGNVQSFTGTEGKSIFVDVVHPGEGPDATVQIIDVATLRVMATVRCGFTDQGPKRASFSPIASGSRTYNIIVAPVGASFGSVGIIINANETSVAPGGDLPFVTGPNGEVRFSGAVSIPSGKLTLSDPRSFATIGDSHLASWTSTPSQFAPFGDQWNNHVFLHYWMMLTGWRNYPRALLAVGGKRTDEILAEQLPALLALKPGFVWEASGTNDGIQGISLATIIANTKSLYDSILAAGIGLRVYIAPIWTSGATTAKSAIMLQLREWKYDYAKQHDGVLIYDHHQLAVDYASATASAESGYLRDGIHTNHIASWIAGKAFADQDIARFGGLDPLVPGYDSTLGISAGPATDDLRQLYRFPGLPGSSAEGNTGMSGVRPGNGWYGVRYGSATGVGALTTVGNGWQRYDITKAASVAADSVVHGFGFGAADYAILAAPATRRRIIQLSIVRRQASMSGVRGDNINFGLTVNGVAKTMVAGANYGSSAAVYPNGVDRTMEWRTPPLEIPAGGTVSGGSIVVSSTLDAGGTVIDGIEQVRIFDVSRLYDGV